MTQENLVKRLNDVDHTLKLLYLETNSLEAHRELLAKQLDADGSHWGLVDEDVIDSIAILTGTSIWDIQDQIGNEGFYDLVLASLKNFKAMYRDKFVDAEPEEVEALDDVAVIGQCLEEIETELKSLRRSPVENADRIGELVHEATDLREQIKIRSNT